MVLLTTGATFNNGNCNGLRTTKYNSSLVINHNYNDDQTHNHVHVIMLRGLWSKSYNSGVKITKPFYLYIGDDTSGTTTFLSDL